MKDVFDHIDSNLDARIAHLHHAFILADVPVFVVADAEDEAVVGDEVGDGLEVEVDGTRYDEMHVDGGTANQVFLYPAALEIAAMTATITSAAAATARSGRRTLSEMTAPTMSSSGTWTATAP